MPKMVGVKNNFIGSSPIRLLIVFFLFLALAFSTHTAIAGSNRLSVEEISRKLDELYRADSSRGLVEMTVTTPHYTRSIEIKVWSRGIDDTLMQIISPRKEKGTATLKKGNEMWNYLPKIKKTIRIPPSMMMGSWMGSDFTNDDIVKDSTWEKDYSAVLVENPPPGRIGIVYVPKEDAAVTWSKVVGWMDEDDYMPITMEYFDEKDRRVRIMEFSDIQEMGGRKLPAKIAMTPLSEDKKGHKTEMVYKQLEFNVELPPNFFALGNLRKENLR